jgi:recombination protein RecT
VTNAAPNPQQLLKHELEKIKAEMARILPKHVTADRMIKVVLSATNRQPKLLECTTSSICRAVMQAAELGLELGGLLGEAYLVPYNVKIPGGGRVPDRWETQAQCIVGYKGYLKLARQGGEVKGVDARVAYRDDAFEIILGLSEDVIHRPNLHSQARDDKDIIAVYCIINLTDGSKQFDYMTKAEVDKIRGRSKSKDSGPWVTDYAEMARKTVTRRTMKYASLSSEQLARAQEIDDENDGVITTVGESVPDASSALNDKLFGPATPSAREQLHVDQPQPEPVPVKTEKPQTAPKAVPVEPTHAPPTQPANDAPPVAQERSWGFCATCGVELTTADEPVRTSLGPGKGIGFRHGKCLPPGMGDGSASWGMPPSENGEQ